MLHGSLSLETNSLTIFSLILFLCPNPVSRVRLLALSSKISLTSWIVKIGRFNSSVVKSAAHSTNTLLFSAVDLLNASKPSCFETLFEVLLFLIISSVAMRLMMVPRKQRRSTTTIVMRVSSSQMKQREQMRMPVANEMIKETQISTSSMVIWYEFVFWC